MARTVIISRDAAILSRVNELDEGTVTWVEDCASLESALSLAVQQVIVDLNIEWDRDLAHCITECKERGASSVIAFLHERTPGDLAIRAHVAGADRVIPQSQLEDEFDLIIGRTDASGGGR